MPRYTTEYKDLIHKAAMLADVVSNATMSRIAGDIADTLQRDSKIEVLDDIEALLDAMDKYTVVG